MPLQGGDRVVWHLKAFVWSIILYVLIVERQTQHEPNRLKADRPDHLKKPKARAGEETGRLLGPIFLFLVIGIY